MSTFGAILSGGDQLIFDASDFTSVKLANGKKGSPRPTVSRVILTPLQALAGTTYSITKDIVGEDTRGNVGMEARMMFRGYESDQHQSTPVAWLRSGRIMIDFFMRGPMKRAVCSLTKNANAQLQVWLDSMEEQGKIKS